MLYLENAIESFASARSNLGRDGTAEHFYHRLSNMIPDTIDVDTLILALKIALNDAEKRGDNTLSFIAVVPQYVEQCASFEFAHEFRQKYIKEVLGIDQAPIPDVDYGIKEVSKCIIDISKKDLNEVIAALYNAACPVGNGFMQYDPDTWDARTAEYYLEQFKDEITTEEGDIHIKYILGRPINVTIHNGQINVRGYNNDNEQGLGERVIRTIPDKKNNKANKKRSL